MSASETVGPVIGSNATDILRCLIGNVSERQALAAIERCRHNMHSGTPIPDRGTSTLGKLTRFKAEHRLTNTDIDTLFGLPYGRCRRWLDGVAPIDKRLKRAINFVEWYVEKNRAEDDVSSIFDF